MVSRAALLGAALLCGAPADAARADTCRLALVLGMDISSSVDAQEDRLQRQGLAAALLAPEVQTAIFAAPHPVALSVFEWSGRYNQEVLVEWTLLNTQADLVAAANTIAQSTRSYDVFQTAVGSALAFAGDLMTRGPSCARTVLDLAGDGVHNDGLTAKDAYQAPVFADVTVNGLVVELLKDPAQAEVQAYYVSHVLHGPAAFLAVARGFDDYERAMRQKLEREIAPRFFSALTPAQPPAPG